MGERETGPYRREGNWGYKPRHHYEKEETKEEAEAEACRIKREIDDEGKPHYVQSEGCGPIRIKTTFDIVSQESSKEGDFEETGWEDKEGQEFESIDEAIQFLKNEGAINPSASLFDPNIWFETEPETDLQTGNEKTRSFHIEATPQQKLAIFEGLMRRKGMARTSQMTR